MNEAKLDIIELELIRDVRKHLLRGHRWVFDDCLKAPANISSCIAILKYKNAPVALGLYQADSRLRFRVLTLIDRIPKAIDAFLNDWLQKQLKNALGLRKGIDRKVTSGIRLVNGEGDGLPGMVIDLYCDTAVIKHDHPVCSQFYNHEKLAQLLLQDEPSIKNVYLKKRNDDESDKGEVIVGKLAEEVVFLENGVKFATNIRDGAKTGFFLDQRDNRLLISKLSQDKSVLNLFSYTGGFSVFAALGGAREVTSVDISPHAIKAAVRNFEVNSLNVSHHAICADAFLFVEESLKNKREWDLVITDPPSFAPNQKSLDNAISAYEKIFYQSLRLVKKNGLFAASSCSSHLTTEKFLEICQEAFSRTRKKGTVLYLGGQPFDHPYLLAMPELRYLKFALFQVS